MCNLIKTFPLFSIYILKKTVSIFHCAQAAPTRYMYRDRSHWFGPVLSIKVWALCFKKIQKINAKIARRHAFLINVEQSADGFQSQCENCSFLL